MESGIIPDSSLSASSSYNEQSVGPQNARLNRELNGGAWCPLNQINQTNSGNEWIQIELNQTMVITKIATQGRFGNGMGVEFCEYFWINYTRDNGRRWIRWKNFNGQFDINGNVDTYSVVENILSIPLVGVTAIRLLPVSSYTRTCCLRLEIYGCPYNDGPISYSMYDGQLNGRFGNLIDYTYDGYRNEMNFLTNGIGQLLDGIYGHDNYKYNNGFEWIGWNSLDQQRSTLTITFEFQEIRNFTSALVYCHNLFTHDIQVFHSARIWFSFDGINWSTTSEQFYYMPDRVLENARNVIIHLNNRIGRFVRFEFKFSAKWLLISEIKFQSNKIFLSNNSVDGNKLILNEFIDNKTIMDNDLLMTNIHDNIDNNVQTIDVYNQFFNNNNLYKEPFLLILIIIIIVIIIIIIIIIISLWYSNKFCHCCNKQKQFNNVPEYTTVPLKDVSSSSPTSAAIYCEPNGFYTNNNNQSIIQRQQQQQQHQHHQKHYPYYYHQNFLQQQQQQQQKSLQKPLQKNFFNSHLINHNYNEEIDAEYAVPDLIDHNIMATATANKTKGSNKLMNFLIEKNLNNGIDDGKARYYASTDVLLRHNQNNLNNSNSITTSTTTPSSISSSNRSNNSKIFKLNNCNNKIENYENVSTNSNNGEILMKSPKISKKFTTTVTTTLPLINENELTMVKGTFGYFKYGTCRLCCMASNVHKNSGDNDGGDKQMVVLQVFDDDNQDEDLRKEILIKLQDVYQLICNNKWLTKYFTNIIGYSQLNKSATTLIYEYNDLDLKKFLLNNSKHQLIRNEYQLIAIIKQLAIGMKYLHEQNLLHCDLAARNCLIFLCNNDVINVKIFNNFLTENYKIINNDYYNEYYKKYYPIRWMSFETIKQQNLYNNKTDVFSFGVTIWEIMKYCQQIPHQLLNDDELLNEILSSDLNDDFDEKISYDYSSSIFYNHPFINDNKNLSNNNKGQRKKLLQLQKPKDCPEYLYDLIIECTQIEQQYRPEFYEIVNFLQQQNIHQH